MNGARATLKNAPVSPQKARLIADLIRKKSVLEARNILLFSDKRGARLVGKLLDSAIANAQELEANEQWHEGGEIDEETLVVKTIFVDEGVRMKRIQPRARGMAFRIIKRRCHITVEIDDRAE
ncbi:MAG: 50S ribosomal protein L22 [Candidatus Poribacteria bacterium]|nr:50S ribosomal protein L22 [Candidatus Poribacteria bacterium]